MLLNDKEIMDRCLWKSLVPPPTTWGPMIAPFNMVQVTQAQNGGRAISSGLSSVGYDIRLGSKIKMFRPTLYSTVVDPKNFKEAQLLEEYDVRGGGYEMSGAAFGAFDLPPHGYVLGVSMERFHMPDDVAAICLTKSTYARCGILLNTTPLEPGWTGYLTLEIANLTDLAIRVYTGEGIAQVMFFKHNRPDVTYGDRNGKYMDQEASPMAPRTVG